ncbi:MAG TPA: hypothetical protein VIY29_22020, partial [Ktedonobacteraceae bacterium]
MPTLPKEWSHCAKGWSAMIASLGNTQARQLTQLYRALRLYVNCCRTLDETLVEATGWEESAMRLRPS